MRQPRSFPGLRGSIGVLLREAGFAGLEFGGARRLPHFWKSMVACASRPNKSCR